MSERPWAVPESNGDGNGRLLPPVSKECPTSPVHGMRNAAAHPVGGRPAPLCRWLARRILERTRIPARLVLWNGEEVTGPVRPVATVHIRDRRALWRLVWGIDPAFGETYREGRVDVEGDLVEFLKAAFRPELDTSSGRPPGRGLLGRLRPRRNNSPTKSRHNVYHHYDVGNDFYRLWLDEQLVYTCAYFPSPSLTLEQAQAAKMDHVCRKLRLGPGQTVIEAGCGWGALARHMARHYGVRVTAYNLSHEQITYARARAQAEGLDDRVQYVEGDYRTVTGRCDAFVSIGMLEHVGREHYRTLGAVIHRCLKPTGIGLIHSIGRNRPMPMSPWLDRHIFPGGYIPSLGEMMAVFEPWNFSVLDVENLRLHYARTLAHWLARFDAVAEQVRHQFDEAFVRTWRLYLASSQAAFTVGLCQLFQVVFAPAANNEIPWSRSEIYLGELSRAEGDRSDGEL
jgi:cyclopropane-fatty-acyl-phospholipid synthase